jgi:hypothetical protein
MTSCGPSMVNHRASCFSEPAISGQSCIERRPDCLEMGWDMGFWKSQSRYLVWSACSTLAMAKKNIGHVMLITGRATCRTSPPDATSVTWLLRCTGHVYDSRRKETLGTFFVGELQTRKYVFLARRSMLTLWEKKLMQTESAKGDEG